MNYPRKVLSNGRLIATIISPLVTRYETDGSFAVGSHFDVDYSYQPRTGTVHASTFDSEWRTSEDQADPGRLAAVKAWCAANLFPHNNTTEET